MDWARPSPLQIDVRSWLVVEQFQNGFDADPFTNLLKINSRHLAQYRLIVRHDGTEKRNPYAVAPLDSLRIIAFRQTRTNQPLHLRLNTMHIMLSPVVPHAQRTSCQVLNDRSPRF